MNIKNILIGLGAVILVLVLLGLPKTGDQLGGTFNSLMVDFAEGLSVDGTTAIDGSRGGSFTTLSSSSTTALGSTSAGVTLYQPVTTLTSDTTVTAAQTGTIFNIGTAGVDVTLPAPTAANGVHYRFVVSAAFATTAMTIVAGTADTIEGSLIVAGAVVACDAADLISISPTSEDIGDFVDVFSNGTNWIIGANQAMTASQHTCSG